MEKVLDILNRKHIAWVAVLVFTIWTCAMAYGCYLNYDTTFSSLATRMPHDNAVGATVAIQVAEFAIPLFLALKIADFFGFGSKMKLGFAGIWALASVIDWYTAFHYFMTDLPKGISQPDTFQVVVGVLNATWYLLAEVGVAMGIIGFWISLTAAQGQEMPGWFAETHPAVDVTPFHHPATQNRSKPATGSSLSPVSSMSAQSAEPTDNAPVDALQRPGETRLQFVNRVRPKTRTPRFFGLSLGALPHR